MVPAAIVITVCAAVLVTITIVLLIDKFSGRKRK